jgi:prevent-host-death family protein
MKTVNIHQAKTTLSQLIEAVEAGEEVILARAGRPVARLTGLARSRGIRFGTGKRLLSGIPRDFDRPLSRRDQDRLFGGSLEP